MIIDTAGMKKMEADSGFSSYELMEKAGQAVADAVRKEAKEGSRIAVICGRGNNGGDGYVAARLLSDYAVSVLLAEGKPVSECAKKAFSLLPNDMLAENAEKLIAEADIIIDAVYGFSYHGRLLPEIRKLFRMINASDARIFSIDINSGAEADSGNFDEDAVISEVTFALECFKPFHMMRKDHRLFERAQVLSLGLKHEKESLYPEMNEEIFFQHFPRKGENAYKGTYGRCAVIGGSYGMAGALCLNLIGTETIGAPYVLAACPDSIYPIAASRFLTTVFHPFREDNMYETIEPMIYQARAICFGSGCVSMPRKDEILDLVLQTAEEPVVLDAEALRLLNHNYYVLRFVHEPVILTPHIGEFAALINRPMEVVMHERIALARRFAQEYHVILVLKGPHTLVVDDTGRIYINQSGSQALAQAGSGDLLTGMITAMLTMNRDVYQAVCMAVWLHGYLAELGTKDASIQNFRLERFPSLMDALFHRHGF